MTHPDLNDVSTTTLLRAWYVVARSVDISGKPSKVTLCGRPLVVFRGSDNAVRALDAMCPHRGADLSRGSVRDDCIVCPYHGWRFNGQGHCTHIPTQPDQSSNVTIGAYPILEQDGFVWVCLVDESGIAPPPRLSLLDTSNMSTFWVERQMKIPMVWWVENMLDVTHVPFTHASTFGGDAVADLDVQLQYNDEPLSGFQAHMEMKQEYNWLTRVLYKQRESMNMNVTIHHWMPGVTCFEVKLQGGRTQLLWSLVSPVDETTCITWLGIGRDYWHIPGLRWFTDGVGRWFARRVLDEDQRLGEQAMIALTTLHMKRPQSVAADTVCLAFIKLFRKLLVSEQGDEPTSS